MHGLQTERRQSGKLLTPYYQKSRLYFTKGVALEPPALTLIDVSIEGSKLHV